MNTRGTAVGASEEFRDRFRPILRQIARYPARRNSLTVAHHLISELRRPIVWSIRDPWRTPQRP